MPLLDLPNEILDNITEFLSPPHIAPLVKANRQCHTFFEPILYKQDARSESPAALLWATYRGSVEIATKALAYMKQDGPVPRKLSAGYLPSDLPTFNARDLIADYLPRSLTSTNNIREPVTMVPPLGLAAMNGHKTIVRLLLASGKACVNVRDGEKRTPLILALAFGNTATAEVLLGVEGVDALAWDHRGRSALMYAAREGSLRLVEQLVSVHGGDPGQSSRYRQTPLWYAMGPGCDAVVRYLLDTGRVDASGPMGYNERPLVWAAALGRAKVVEMLLTTEGVDPMALDDRGVPALWYAANQGHDAVVRCFFDTGNEDLLRCGYMAFIWAVTNGHKSTVRLLLNTYDVNAQQANSDDYTALHFAAANDREDMVQLLLDIEGTDPNARDRYMRTPLMHAAKHDSISVIRLLLKRGADPEAKDDAENTAIAVAKNAGHDDAAAMMMAAVLDKRMKALCLSKGQGHKTPDL